MVVINNIEHLIYDEELCWIEKEGSQQAIFCYNEPYSVPDEYIEFEKRDIKGIVDKYFDDVVKYILNNHLPDLYRIARELGIEITIPQEALKLLAKQQEKDELDA